MLSNKRGTVHFASVSDIGKDTEFDAFLRHFEKSSDVSVPT